MPHPRYFVNTNYHSLPIYSLTPAARLHSQPFYPFLPSPIPSSTPRKNPGLAWVPSAQTLPGPGLRILRFPGHRGRPRRLRRGTNRPRSPRSTRHPDDSLRHGPPRAHPLLPRHRSIPQRHLIPPLHLTKNNRAHQRPHNSKGHRSHAPEEHEIHPTTRPIPIGTGLAFHTSKNPAKCCYFCPNPLPHTNLPPRSWPSPRTQSPPPAKKIFPSGISKSSRPPTWPRIPRPAAAWSSSPGATASGKPSRVTSTHASRPPDTRTPTSPSSSPSPTSKKKQSTLKALPPNAPWSPTTALRPRRTPRPAKPSWCRAASSPSLTSSAPPPKRSSALPFHAGSSPTVTSPSSSTSGPTSCVGKCVPASSSAPPNSSGRKAIPRTSLKRRPSWRHA